MSELFSRRLVVRWADLDANGHMKNTAYLDACVDVRMMYFSSQGFALNEFERLKIGPVVQRDEVDYSRELRLLEPFDVTLCVAGLSADGTRFRLRNEFFRADGQRAARVVSTGGWLDLQARRLAVPPQHLRDVLAALVRTEDFAVLESSVRS